MLGLSRCISSNTHLLMWRHFPHHLSFLGLYCLPTCKFYEHQKQYRSTNNSSIDHISFSPYAVFLGMRGRRNNVIIAVSTFGFTRGRKMALAKNVQAVMLPGEFKSTVSKSIKNYFYVCELKKKTVGYYWDTLQVTFYKFP